MGAINHTLQLRVAEEPAFKIAFDIQLRIFPPLVTAAGIFFILGILLLGARALAGRIKESSQSGSEESRSKGARLIGKLRSAHLLFISTILSLASAAAVMQTGNALQFATKIQDGGDSRPILIQPGKRLQVLQWLGFAFSTILSLCVALWESPPSEREDYDEE